MAHRYRFHVPPGQAAIGEFQLPPEESHHAARVARLNPGDPVEIFSGDGRTWPAVVTGVAKKTVTVEAGEPTSDSRSGHPASLCVGWPNHGTCVEEVLRRATEFEAERVVFFKADRSERAPLLKEKFMRICIESAKQCGTSWLPELETIEDFDALIEHVDGRLLVAHIGDMSTPWEEALQGLDRPALVIGPEGGISERELAVAKRAELATVSLGSRILRTEVAAAVGLTLLQHHLGNL